MTSPAHQNWQHRPERGSLVTLRVMVKLSLLLGRNTTRWLLYAIVPYFLLFAPVSARASREYLVRILPRRPRWTDLFQHFLTFATTLHDRIFLLNGAIDQYPITVHGIPLLDELAQANTGVILMGGHLGSFEILHTIARSHPEIRISILMYPDNAQKIQSVLRAINPINMPDIIPLGQPHAMLEVQNRLEAGHWIGILADRGLGDTATAHFEFLGTPAPFPLGPFRLAAALKKRVIFMAGLYKDGRYDLHFEALADFTHTPRQQRDAAIAAAQADYVGTLEFYCRQAPYNWFNFFDFWSKSHAKKPTA